MLKIGLTGGIACGKSYIGQLFKAYGVTIIDADIISREVVEPSMPALQQLAEVFGAEILDEKGELKRRLLRQIVFNSTDALDQLNRIVHPAIHNRMLELTDIAGQGLPLPSTYLNLVARQAALAKPQDLDTKQAQEFTTPLDPALVFPQNKVPPYVILDIPLLFENNLTDLVDLILVVDVPQDVQVRRIMARDCSSEEAALKIINSQVPREQRLQQADYIIDTSTSNLEEKRTIVLNLHNKFIALAHQ